MTESLNVDALRVGLMERYLRAAPLNVREAPADLPESEADLTPPPGTITVFYARDGSILSQLAAALQQGDTGSLARLRANAEEHRTRNIMTDADAISAVQRADTVFDIRYAGRTVATNRVLPAGEMLGSVVLSWTGGAIDDNEFSVVEYNTSEAAGQRLSYLAYRRAPYLTDLERSMLERVPAELSEINIAAIIASETKTMEEIARMVEREAKHAAQTRTCGPDILEDLQQLIFEGRISPEASVRELVRARLELMTRSRL